MAEPAATQPSTSVELGLRQLPRLAVDSLFITVRPLAPIPSPLALSVGGGGLRIASLWSGLFLGRPATPLRGEPFVHYEHELPLELRADDPRRLPPCAR